MTDTNSPETSAISATFEEDMQSLEHIVNRMEQGELSLEDALGAFENGIKLIRNCEQTLRNAEQKVQILMSNDGQNSLQPFDSQNEPDA